MAETRFQAQIKETVAGEATAVFRETATEMRFRSHSSYADLNMLEKADFLRFNGDNIEDWLFQIEQFFLIDRTPEELKVGIASIHFDDIAATLHQSIVQSMWWKHVRHDWWSYKLMLQVKYNQRVEEESSETEQRTVNREANADMNLAILEEESIPQFHVSISDSEILSNFELREENSVLENPESVVMNENLEQDGVRKYVNMKFDVDGDAEGSQKVLSSTKNCCAHQVFGKMSQYKEKLGAKKKTKGFKSWMFKYKSAKGKIKKQDNQGWFHTWSRKVCWKKNKTTKLQFVLHVYEAMNHSTDSVPEPSLVHRMCLPLKHQVSNSYWKFSHRSPIESLNVYEDLFAIVRSHCSTSPFDLEYAANIARQVFDSLPLRIKLLQNLRKEMLSKTWRFKFKKLDVMQEDVQQVLLAFLPMNVIETRYAIGEHEKMFKMARAISMISMIGLTSEIIENDAGQQATYELFVMVNERLLQTSLVIQQVMRNKKIKTSKRWWFKYKYVTDGIKRLQIQLRYKCWLEFKEWFKNWGIRESWRKHKKIQLFTLRAREGMEEDMMENDQQQEDNESLMPAPNFVTKNRFSPYMVVLVKPVAYATHFLVGIGMDTRQCRLSLRTYRVWDPGGFIVEDATPWWIHMFCPRG